MPVTDHIQDGSSGATIDIMMPFYGRFDHFREAVESVRSQSDPQWRLVVIDDVYPDTAPGEWLTRLGDRRIEYVRNKHNLGVSGNFRRSVELSRADYVVIMGCDDIMLPGYVARVRALAIAHPSVAIIQPGVEVIDENGARALPLGDRVKALYRIRGAKPAIYGGERLAKSLVRGNWTYFPSLCWNSRDLAKHQFRHEFDVVLDLALQLEIILDGGTMLVDDNTCFLYRRHAASVSSWKADDGSRFIQEADLFQETDAAMRALGWRAAARSARAHLTSRLHAVTRMPQALRSGSAQDRRVLAAHIFGTRYRPSGRPSAPKA